MNLQINTREGITQTTILRKYCSDKSISRCCSYRQPPEMGQGPDTHPCCSWGGLLCIDAVVGVGSPCAGCWGSQSVWTCCGTFLQAAPSSWVSSELPNQEDGVGEVSAAAVSKAAKSASRSRQLPHSVLCRALGVGFGAAHPEIGPSM